MTYAYGNFTVTLAPAQPGESFRANGKNHWGCSLAFLTTATSDVLRDAAARIHRTYGSAWCGTVTVVDKRTPAKNEKGESLPLFKTAIVAVGAHFEGLDRFVWPAAQAIATEVAA